MKMKEEEYNNIIGVIRSYCGSHIGPNRKLETILKNNFPNVSEKALNSIYSFDYQRRIKQDRPRHFKASKKMYKMYLDEVEKTPKPGILLNIAEAFDVPPSLLARMILEKHYEKLAQHDESIVASKKFITKLMKDTTLIQDRTLAYEVFLCNLNDDQYGPIAECINYSVGQEYEMKLHEKVKELKIPYRDEEQMRQKGYDKTPDVKLDIPFAVDGFIVNWIESKALFGDGECHRTFLKEQFLSYWNRFGTGLVIYWFGHMDTLEQQCDNKMIIRDHFPTNIQKMDPKLIKPCPLLM